MVKKVLVPIDSIKNSYTFLAVEEAMDFATGCWMEETVELIFLHVFNSSVKMPTGRSKRIEDLDQEEIKLEFKTVKDMCEDRGVENIRTRVGRGETHAQIVELAQEEDVDLIIMGSGKLHDESVSGKINKFFYGSVTEDVVHEAPCSVLVVRPEMDFEKILVPVDSIEWDNTKRSVENAMDFAEAYQKKKPKLIFMHVFHSPTGAEMNEERLELERERIEREFEMIKGDCEERGISNIDTIVKEGDPDKERSVGEEVVETSMERNVDIVAMGSGKLHDRSMGGRVQKFVYGSVTEEVLHKAPSSILIARSLA